MDTGNYGRIIEQGGLPSGLPLKITAVIKRNWLNINFCKSSDETSIGFHASIRPDENKIICNQLSNGVWGTEEHFGGSPINYNNEFTVLISVNKDKYVIDINGKHFADFQHRCRVEDLKYLSLHATECNIKYFGININQ